LAAAASPSLAPLIGEEFFMPLCTLLPDSGSVLSIFEFGFWNIKRKDFCGLDSHKFTMGRLHFSNTQVRRRSVAPVPPLITT
jgi:hypothetical protein